MLYLVRHGETEWSRGGRHTSRTDLELTPDGVVGAARAGRVLRGLADPVPRVVCSPRRRALETARHAGLVVDETTEDLAEWDYGEYEGLTTPQIRERVPGWTVWTHPCPGGEGAEQVAARARRVLERVGPDAVLVGHGHFSRVLAAVHLGQEAPFGVHLAMDAGRVTVLGDERGVPQIKASNVEGTA